MQVLSPSRGKEAVSSSRLLIVDDDAYLRATLRQQLAVEGFNDVFEVGVVADLDNALSHANPDLILLDIQMPDGNGIDICQRLRRNGFAKPIVMLTAKGAEGDIVLGLEAGANDYITKPLRLGEWLRVSAPNCASFARRMMRGLKLAISALCQPIKCFTKLAVTGCRL